MRTKLIIALALTAGMVGCLDSLDIVDAEVMTLLQEGTVAEVICPDSLALLTNESGECHALNANGTLLVSSDVSIAKWSSSNVEAVSVDLTGVVTAQAVVDTVWIVARGTLDTRDSTQVFTY